jgi:hypothetical protein
MKNKRTLTSHFRRESAKPKERENPKKNRQTYTKNET